MQVRHCHSTRRPASIDRRAGLAPLELVLSLPIMLLVMVLMIIMGTVGAWKVRTLANSRQAVWRSFAQRTGENDPHPRGWPPEAEMRSDAGTPPLIDEDAFADYPVVRGPILVAEDEPDKWLPVRDPLLDVNDGLRKGHAHIDRPFPIGSKIPPHKTDVTRDHVVFDGSRWQFPTMGLPSNLTRRVPQLYPFDLAARSPGSTDAYLTSARDIYRTWLQPGLAPLDHDDELVPWRMQQDFHPPWRTAGQHSLTDKAVCPACNSQARFRNPRRGDDPQLVCTLNPLEVYEEFVFPLIDQIVGRPASPGRPAVAGVPERLTRAFIGLYEEQKRRLRRGEPPPPGAQFQANLDGRLAQLRRFLQILP